MKAKERHKLYKIYLKDDWFEIFKFDDFLEYYKKHEKRFGGYFKKGKK